MFQIKMQLPKLNLSNVGGNGFGVGGLGLNLAGIPSGKAKEESHFVYLCSPFKSSLSQEQFDQIKDNVEDEFGEGTKIFQITKIPEQWVIQPPENAPNVIPSLAVIDSAYQDLQHIPNLLDDCCYQQTVLTKEIDNKVAENEKLLEEKHKLQIENAVLAERIRALEEQLRQ